MSQTITRSAEATTTVSTPRATSARWGLLALVVAVVTAIYGAYGDPHPKTSQQQAVPFICAVMIVVVAAIYGLLLPAGLRGVATRPGRWSGWALAIGIVAMLATPVSFWSGLPFVLGTAGAVLGSAARRGVTVGRGLPTTAVVLSVIGAAGSLILCVLGNTILPG